MQDHVKTRFRKLPRHEFGIRHAVLDDDHL
jgi:hypothetical protein